jgi:hypothetical protein
VGSNRSRWAAQRGTLSDAGGHDRSWGPGARHTIQVRGSVFGRLPSIAIAISARVQWCGVAWRSEAVEIAGWRTLSGLQPLQHKTAVVPSRSRLLCICGLT